MALDSFTTIELTRADAGFANNTNITDPTIEVFVKAANGEMNTAIAGRYVVPLSNDSQYSGSLAESYLKNLATSLASGLLMLRQYEGQGGDMEDLALAKIRSVRTQLKEIQKGMRVLIGTDGNEFDLRNSSRQSIDGFPESATANPSVFSMDDVY